MPDQFSVHACDALPCHTFVKPKELRKSSRALASVGDCANTKTLRNANRATTKVQILLNQETIMSKRANRTGCWKIGNNRQTKNSLLSSWRSRSKRQNKTNLDYSTTAGCSRTNLLRSLVKHRRTGWQSSLSCSQLPRRANSTRGSKCWSKQKQSYRQ